jgi:hypothetical protein
VGDAARDADVGPDARGEVNTRSGAAAQRHGLRALALAVPLCLCAAVPPASAQTWRTVTSARQLHGEHDLAVHVEYGAGRFRLRPGAEGELYRLEMRYDEEKFTPVRSYDAAAGTLQLGVHGRDGVRVSLGDNGHDDEPPYLDLALSPDIPLTLDLELGAVESNVDLGGLALRSVRYRTGASDTRLTFDRPNPVACDELTMEAGAAEFEARQLANANCARVTFRGGVGHVTLDFGGSWRHSMTADLNVGIGTLQLMLPRDVGVEVHLSRFLASFDAAGFTKRGDVYQSGNFATARQRLVLHVNASLGGIDVAWVGPGQ